MQRRGPRFLRASQNEIEPLDFAPSTSEHCRNVTEILVQVILFREAFEVRKKPALSKVEWVSPRRF